MARGEPLSNLDAAAMAMHVAEAADVHQNVEAELLPGTESAQHLIMPAAMAQAQVNNLAPDCLSRRLHRLANLPVRIMAVLINQRRRQLDFQRLLFQKIDHRRRRDRQISHQFRRDLPQFAPGFDFIGIRIGILHQRRRDSHFAQQFLLRTRRPTPAKPRESLPPIPATIPDSRCMPAISPPLQQFAQTAALLYAYARADAKPAISRVRALTISPSEVFAASGNRYREISKARARKRALVRLLLHLIRLGRDAGQVLEHVLRKRFVFGEQTRRSFRDRTSARRDPRPTSPPKSGM